MPVSFMFLLKSLYCVKRKLDMTLKVLKEKIDISTIEVLNPKGTMYYCLDQNIYYLILC